jgi:hypothetical protein
MIRIIGPLSSAWGSALYQIYAQPTFFKCCNAISHLQHKAEIPNFRDAKLAQVPKPPLSFVSNLLQANDFTIWHGSC